MDQDNEPQDLQPPSYTSYPPQVMRPTNNKMKDGQPTIIPIGQPILDRNGQPMQIQHGTIKQPGLGEATPALIPAIVGIQMGPDPTNMTCPSCQEDITTNTEYTRNAKTNMMACIYGIICLWPCVIFTFTLDSYRNTDHHCPNCQTYIGSYVR